MKRLATMLKSLSNEAREYFREILQEQPTAVRDAKNMNKPIHTGCCTTYSVIKPEGRPAVFESYASL